ncbi:unnamed protein product, partial [Musa textilis]
GADRQCLFRGVPARNEEIPKLSSSAWGFRSLFENSGLNFASSRVRLLDLVLLEVLFFGRLDFR